MGCTTSTVSEQQEGPTADAVPDPPIQAEKRAKLSQMHQLDSAAGHDDDSAFGLSTVRGIMKKAGPLQPRTQFTFAQPLPHLHAPTPTYTHLPPHKSSALMAACGTPSPVETSQTSESASGGSNALVAHVSTPSYTASESVSGGSNALVAHVTTPSYTGVHTVDSALNICGNKLMPPGRHIGESRSRRLRPLCNHNSMEHNALSTYPTSVESLNQSEQAKPKGPGSNLAALSSEQTMPKGPGSNSTAHVPVHPPPPRHEQHPPGNVCHPQAVPKGPGSNSTALSSEQITFRLVKISAAAAAAAAGQSVVAPTTHGPASPAAAHIVAAPTAHGPASAGENGMTSTQANGAICHEHQNNDARHRSSGNGTGNSKGNGDSDVGNSNTGNSNIDNSNGNSSNSNNSNSNSNTDGSSEGHRHDHTKPNNKHPHVQQLLLPTLMDALLDGQLTLGTPQSDSPLTGRNIARHQLSLELPSPGLGSTPITRAQSRWGEWCDDAVSGVDGASPRLSCASGMRGTSDEYTCVHLAGEKAHHALQEEGFVCRIRSQPSRTGERQGLRAAVTTGGFAPTGSVTPAAVATTVPVTVTSAIVPEHGALYSMLHGLETTADPSTRNARSAQHDSSGPRNSRAVHSGEARSTKKVAFA